jgi:hypothetical protein
MFLENMAMSLVKSFFSINRLYARRAGVWRIFADYLRRMSRNPMIVIKNFKARRIN